jgi:hypothetical protein
MLCNGARGIHTRTGLKPVKRKTRSGRTPTDWLEVAFTHDRAGRESEAIPFYRKALSSGALTRAQLWDASICLGSSYSTSGSVPPLAVRAPRRTAFQLRPGF